MGVDHNAVLFVGVYDEDIDFEEILEKYDHELPYDLQYWGNGYSGEYWGLGIEVQIDDILNMGEDVIEKYRQDVDKLLKENGLEDVEVSLHKMVDTY